MTTSTDEALRACEGFEVVSPDGRVGYVDRLLFDPGEPTPAILVIRVGLFRPHTLLAAIADVAAVDPERHRLALAGSTTVVRPEDVLGLEAKRAPTGGSDDSASRARDRRRPVP